MSASQQPLSGVLWFDISDPNSLELDKLADRFGFHELQVEDCRHRPQRAKMEEYENYIFCVLKHLRNDADFTFEDFDLFLTKNGIVSVHEPNSDILEKARARAEQSKVPDVDKFPVGRFSPRTVPPGSNGSPSLSLIPPPLRPAALTPKKRRRLTSAAWTVCRF